MSAALPVVLFVNINGSGMGHMNRCLAYARRLQGQARPFFFSMASAMELIEEMGFPGDYFVSHYWSSSSTFAWNSELAVRLGMLLEALRPVVVVFDGTWPFQGFMGACRACPGPRPALVWSNRGLLKVEVGRVPVDEAEFDLVLVPGEPDVTQAGWRKGGGVRRLFLPPVCLLDDDELLDREAAREALGLPQQGRQALLSMGSGNLKDVRGIGQGLIRTLMAAGMEISWAQPPITVSDVPLPQGVRALSIYPLARYLRAFDVFVGAAGYNACCELQQAGIPALLVPNEQLADDQVRRARTMANLGLAVTSACDSSAARSAAVQSLLALVSRRATAVDTTLDPVEDIDPLAATPATGAAAAAQALLQMVRERRA